MIKNYKNLGRISLILLLLLLEEPDPKKLRSGWGIRTKL
jgi:hypothetical protein